MQSSPRENFNFCWAQQLPNFIPNRISRIVVPLMSRVKGVHQIYDFILYVFVRFQAMKSNISYVGSGIATTCCASTGQKLA